MGAGEIRVSARLRKSQIGQDVVAVTVKDTGETHAVHPLPQAQTGLRQG